MARTLKLGNTAVVEMIRTEEGGDYDRRQRSDLGQRVTSMTFPDEMATRDVIAAIEAMWRHQSDEPPAWVESDDEGLAQLAAEVLSADKPIKVGRPKSWKEG